MRTCMHRVNASEEAGCFGFLEFTTEFLSRLSNFTTLQLHTVWNACRKTFTRGQQAHPFCGKYSRNTPHKMLYNWRKRQFTTNIF